MHVLSTLSLGLFTSLAAGWTIQDDYGNDSSFFDKFTFFTDADPTNGFVQYVDQATASGAGMINADNGNVHIGVNTKPAADANGAGKPQSVRLTSTNSYNSGTLVILDLAHMPASACGSWPAFWMVGPNWPSAGEIDIIEGVNTIKQNQMTLHTLPNCTISQSGTGTLVTTGSCDSASNGCGVMSSNTLDFGDGFNAANGGVYATEWTADGINIWYWASSDVPSGVIDGAEGGPDPTTWGTPDAGFTGTGCDFNGNFQNMQIVFDVTFCGDWAGKDFSCGSGSCEEYIKLQANADPAQESYADSYWAVNSLKVYTQEGTDTQQNGSSLLNLALKRDEVPEVGHGHAAQHLNHRRVNPHARPGPRPNRAQRREGLKLAQ